MKTENCICINQCEDNKFIGECDQYDSDGMWFENNELNFWSNYDGACYEVNYCPICGRKLIQ